MGRGDFTAVKEWVKRKEIDVSATAQNKGPALTILLRNHALSDDLRCELAQLLINAKAEPDVFNAERSTALHYDVSVPMLQILLSAHPNVNIQNGFGCTPLFCNAARGKETQCQLLIAARADPNITTARAGVHDSSLIAAVEGGFSKTVAVLLAAGADPGHIRCAVESAVSIANELALKQTEHRVLCVEALQQHWQKLLAIIADVGSPRLPIVLVKVVLSYVCDLPVSPLRFDGFA